jgi:hypothetical protein
MNWPKSRKEGLAVGVRFFVDGKPCCHGHIALRQTINGRCLVCNQRWRRMKADIPVNGGDVPEQRPLPFPESAIPSSHE